MFSISGINPFRSMNYSSPASNEEVQDELSDTILKSGEEIASSSADGLTGRVAMGSTDSPVSEVSASILGSTSRSEASPRPSALAAPSQAKESPRVVDSAVSEDVFRRITMGNFGFGKNTHA